MVPKGGVWSQKWRISYWNCPFQSLADYRVGAWYELNKYNSGHKSENQRQKETMFLNTWSYGGIFCHTINRIKWQLVPHREFLLKDLANQYKSFCSGLTQPHSPCRSRDNSNTQSHNFISIDSRLHLSLQGLLIGISLTAPWRKLLNKSWTKFRSKWTWNLNTRERMRSATMASFRFLLFFVVTF